MGLRRITASPDYRAHVGGNAKLCSRAICTTVSFAAGHVPSRPTANWQANDMDA
jgi:hypothetical protein